MPSSSNMRPYGTVPNVLCVISSVDSEQLDHNRSHLYIRFRRKLKTDIRAREGDILSLRSREFMSMKYYFNATTINLR